jgi:hypothetical protein
MSDIILQRGMKPITWNIGKGVEKKKKYLAGESLN